MARISARGRIVYAGLTLFTVVMAGTCLLFAAKPCGSAHATTGKGKELAAKRLILLAD